MPDRPVLMVIPLPVDVDVFCAVGLGLVGVWEKQYGRRLDLAEFVTETTPWGRALVIREPERLESDRD